MSLSVPIRLSPPHFDGREMLYVQQAMDEGWVSQGGANLDKFEQVLGDYLGVEHVAALNSGTSAIHLALRLLNIKPGDYVICSSFTFVASANPILYEKARPIFVDSEPATWNMDPGLLQDAIESSLKMGHKPAAVIFVHLYGMPGKIEEIARVCQEFEIPLIEDAAEALGASWKGKKVGTFGTLGVYSFNGNKIITTGGGGALVSGNKELIDKAKYLATQAREIAPHYQHSEVGYNYRMSNIAAGIGRGQMEVLEERIKKRRVVFDHYFNEFDHHPGISFLCEPPGTYSNRWLTTMLFHREKVGIDRNDMMIHLEKHNIESRPVWKPMHRQPVFKEVMYFDNGVSDNLFEKGLCLPSGSGLTEKDLNRVVEIMKKNL